MYFGLLSNSVTTTFDANGIEGGYKNGRSNSELLFLYNQVFFAARYSRVLSMKNIPWNGIVDGMAMPQSDSGYL